MSTGTSSNARNSKMSLKTAIKLFENLDQQSVRTQILLDALNVVVNSQDISHMSRKGLYMCLRYIAENLDCLYLWEGDNDAQSEV